MDIIGKRKIWMAMSTILIIIGIASLLTQGLNLGIDFLGGTIIEFEFEDRVEAHEINEILAEFDLEERSTVQQVEDNDVLIRTDELEQEELVNLQNRIQEEFPTATLLRTDVVGPTIGEELSRGALLSLLVAAVAIVIYISIRFEFKFAMAAIIALLHDVLIVVGAFSILGRQINQPLIAALLTIVGYSINDTIVIFDRIREKLNFASKKETFAESANQAVVETLPRSINTSITTLLPILAILFLGGTTIQNFMIALLVGMLAGTYSSIFVASPVLVEWDERSKAKA
ncbi:protein translocase subunit SecF [Natroniella sulfidigena]|uniref:protein translocase subunit SecF n=1 Tax=Natroniella sulfidigena TaxID=723921 RepID=UPI00200A624E|nr:protein translocase subunit SecF [Natroniella sulfidigena]